ncbi:MAG: DUF6438 domain-containing protein [Flavobacteriales bacterium]|jgi:hypothetical protein|nr:DUF6438 domain-containing protein [Flavobacteriales bacterium]
MKQVFLILISTSLLIACASKKESSTNQGETVEVVNTENDDYEFKNVSTSDSLFASIERSPCFGQCPVYSMQIYNSGWVNYKGKNFVQRTGEFTLQLSSSQMLAFVNKAKAIQYLEMDDSYDNPSVTDVASATTSIVLNGTRKKVYRRFGFPKELIEFEQLFDDLLNSDQWKEVINEKDKKF